MTEKKLATPWERIEFKATGESKGQPAEMFRLKVHKGWLVAAGWGLAPGPLVFVPDDEHSWDPFT